MLAHRRSKRWKFTISCEDTSLYVKIYPHGSIEFTLFLYRITFCTEKVRMMWNCIFNSQSLTGWFLHVNLNERNDKNENKERFLLLSFSNIWFTVSRKRKNIQCFIVFRKAKQSMINGTRQWKRWFITSLLHWTCRRTGTRLSPRLLPCTLGLLW